MPIHIFKTDIDTGEKRQVAANILNAMLSIARWNIDRWDADNILKIETEHDNPELIAEEISKAGFECQILED